MDVNALILIATVTVAVLSAVGLGYWMGRNTLIIHNGQVQPKPKIVNLAKAPITEDPYARALRAPDNGRISTVGEDWPRDRKAKVESGEIR